MYSFKFLLSAQKIIKKYLSFSKIPLVNFYDLH